MRPFLADLKLATRHLRRAPGFSLVVILTIALGVGANTSLFTLLNAIALRPVNVPNPDRLVLLTLTTDHGAHDVIPLEALDEFTRRQHAFEAVCGYFNSGLIGVEAKGVHELVNVEVLNGPYYRMLGVRPFLGRLLPAEDLPEDGDAPRIAVLGYGYWQRRFGGDRGVVGQTIRVDGVPVTIIGVTPPTFAGLGVEIAPDISLPTKLMRQVGSASPNRNRPIRANYVVAKLLPRVSPAEAEAQTMSMWPALTAATVPPGYTPEEQASYRAQRVTVQSIETGISSMRPRYQKPLLLLITLSTVLLVIGCVNLGGLLLSRAAARERELSVRVALGATRARLTRQLLTESLVLVLAGAIAAVPLGWWAAHALGTMMWTAKVPLTVSLAPDWRVLAVAAVLTIAAGAAIGAFPAILATRRIELTASQPARTVTAGTGRWGRALLVGQVALSLVLLFGASLLTRSLGNLYGVDLGFRTHDLTFGRTIPVPDGYRNLDEATYYQDLLGRLAALPGVRRVAFSHVFPGPIDERSIARADAADAPEIAGAMDVVTPGFFDVAAMPILEGRDFDWRDDHRRTAVAIINRTLASRLFGSESAIGHHIRIGTDPARDSLEIVGVVSDARLGDIRKPAPPAVFRPSLQEVTSLRQPILQLLTSGAPADFADRLRQTVGDGGREYLPYLGTMDEQIDRTLVQERVTARLAAAFAALAALLAFVGLYGLLAYSVSRRTREIGVRMALGASSGAVLRLIVRQSLTLAALGVAAGVPLALVAARLAGSFLFGLSASDPLTLAGAAVFLAAVGAVAGLRPAWRASRIDPLVALRCD